VRTGHFWVPDAVYDVEISSIARSLYVFICRTISRTSERDYTRAQLAEATGFGVRSVDRALVELKAADMVSVTRSRKRPRPGSGRRGVPGVYRPLPLEVWRPDIFRVQPEAMSAPMAAATAAIDDQAATGAGWSGPSCHDSTTKLPQGQSPGITAPGMPATEECKRDTESVGSPAAAQTAAPRDAGEPTARDRMLPALTRFSKDDPLWLPWARYVSAWSQRYEGAPPSLSTDSANLTALCEARGLEFSGRRPTFRDVGELLVWAVDCDFRRWVRHRHTLEVICEDIGRAWAWFTDRDEWTNA
jgi:hypothetical protein